VIGQSIKVKDSCFSVKAFLGKGKSAYSYLIENISAISEKYVLKQIHNEPCEYYQFGDKLEAEINSYYRLINTGIKTPSLIEYNKHHKYLIKEYIEGQVATSLIADSKISTDIFRQLFEVAGKAKQNNINLDYFPTNFIISGQEMTYIDYELNSYTDEWNLQNWGIFYWLNSAGMKEYLQTQNLLALNINLSSGKPIKAPFENNVSELIRKFSIKY